MSETLLRGFGRILGAAIVVGAAVATLWVWWLTYRGKMHDDPTAFAFRDWGSYVLGTLTLGVMWLAT